MSGKKSKPQAYTATITPMPGAPRETHLYDISGPHGWVLGGQYTGTREQTEKHVGKTLKRLNGTVPHGRTFKINNKVKRAA